MDKVKFDLKNSKNIIAVSKLQPVDKIKNLYDMGQLHFGENYIQEALTKIESLKNLNIIWHLIGPIQSNKVKFLKNNFEYIHSVDSLRLAKMISDSAANLDYIQKVFLQINVSGEDSKSGFTVHKFKQDWNIISSLSHIKIVGLMTMPPLQNLAEDNRIIFKSLKKLAQDYQLTELSMGTSHDYQVAVEEGATRIRLGTILFGERTK